MTNAWQSSAPMLRRSSRMSGKKKYLICRFSNRLCPCHRRRAAEASVQLIQRRKFCPRNKPPAPSPGSCRMWTLVMSLPNHRVLLQMLERKIPWSSKASTITRDLFPSQQKANQVVWKEFPSVLPAERTWTDLLRRLQLLMSKSRHMVEMLHRLLPLTSLVSGLREWQGFRTRRTTTVLATALLNLRQHHFP